MPKRDYSSVPMPASPTASSSVSIRTRRIDNGFVTSVESCDPVTGEYQCNERFSESKPAISAQVVTSDPVRSADHGSLKAAVSKLK